MLRRPGSEVYSVAICLPRNCTDETRTNSIGVQAFAISNIAAYLPLTPFASLSFQCLPLQDVDPVPRWSGGEIFWMTVIVVLVLLVIAGTLLRWMDDSGLLCNFYADDDGRSSVGDHSINRGGDAEAAYGAEKSELAKPLLSFAESGYRMPGLSEDSRNGQSVRGATVTNRVDLLQSCTD